MKIVHISDLHLTSSAFIPEWGERVLNMVDDIEPEIPIVTGDLTDWGYEYEYEEVKEYFGKIKGKK